MMDQDTLVKLHSVMLEILNEFVRICEENNLTYFLAYGTLLGAVRHEGFIPWDDDIDVAMPRNDYEKFINLCENNNDSNYYILSNKCPINTYYHYITFAKFCKRNTIYAETTRNEGDFCGIFIDIWPYDNTYPLLAPLQTALIHSGHKLYRMKTYTSSVYKSRKHLKLQSFLKKLIPTWFCISFYKFTIKLCCIYNKHNTEYISFFSDWWSYKKVLMKRKDIFPLCKLKFGEKDYYAPNNYDLYLKIKYYDYMTLPPVEERKTHGKYIIFDTNETDNNINNN